MIHTLIIEPGQTEPVNGEGDFFAVVLSPCEITIKRPGGTEEVYSQGDDFALAANEPHFKRLEVRNPTAYKVHVQIYAGLGRYGQRRQAVIEPRTRVRAFEGTLAPGASLLLDGSLDVGDIRRKCFSVTNKDPNLSLDVTDSFGTAFAAVFEKSSGIWPIADPVRIKNSQATAIEYTAGEIFWTV